MDGVKKTDGQKEDEWKEDGWCYDIVPYMMITPSLLSYV